jgi:hypothetical protein
MHGVNCSDVKLTAYCATRREWIPQPKILAQEELQLFLAAHYQLDCTGANIVQQILASSRKSYEEYIELHTIDKNYSIDSSLYGLP